jgi:hypothetical protein
MRREVIIIGDLGSKVLDHIYTAKPSFYLVAAYI